MFIIGIDPHRGSHAAVVIDRNETVRAVLELPADKHQRQRLLDWSTEFTPRVWAIEGAAGTGALLAQQLVASGERVIDLRALRPLQRVSTDLGVHRSQGSATP